MHVTPFGAYVYIYSWCVVALGLIGAWICHFIWLSCSHSHACSSEWGPCCSHIGSYILWEMDAAGVACGSSQNLCDECRYTLQLSLIKYWSHDAMGAHCRALDNSCPNPLSLINNWRISPDMSLMATSVLWSNCMSTKCLRCSDACMFPRNMLQNRTMHSSVPFSGRIWKGQVSRQEGSAVGLQLCLGMCTDASFLN